MTRSGRIPLALAAFALLASPNRARAQADASGPRYGANRYEVRFAASEWPDVADLVASHSAFSPPYGGTLKTVGLGLEIGYLRRLSGTSRRAVYLGAEFAGYLHSGDQRYAGSWAGTGQPVEATLYANPGYLVLCGRYVSRFAAQWDWHAGAGGGLYMLSVKDDIAGMNVETGVRDDSAGGYAALGIDRGIRGRHTIVGLEGRAHFFEFRDLDPGFPGQSAGGPLYEVALGIAWAD